LRAAGTNCDAETAYAFEAAGATARTVHVNRIADGSVRLSDFQILAIPGGFTYGDDISAGKVLANELSHRVGDAMREFVDGRGLIIGICNGFQVLVKMGLLPGGDGSRQSVTLTNNDSNRYEDRWVYLKVASTKSPFFGQEEILYLPVAHGEGKFIVDEPGTLKRLEASGQVVLKYCDEKGRDAGFPYNPNGSVGGVAGICSPSGKVFGLMPHPERNIEPFHHPRWTRNGTGAEGDGLRVFRNAVSFFS
jgi:phosphoribosylformylglycinamidine synthase